MHKIKALRKSAYLASAILLSLFSSHSAAELCTFNVVGDSCTFNLDASGLGVGPYNGALYEVTATGILGFPEQTFSWAWFDDLNAQGTPFGTGGPAELLPALLTRPGFLSPIWDDGIASLVLTLDTRSPDLNPLYIHSLKGRFDDSQGQSFIIEATAGSNPVPEPGTLALVSLASLTLFATVRRRRC